MLVDGCDRTVLLARLRAEWFVRRCRPGDAPTTERFGRGWRG